MESLILILQAFRDLIIRYLPTWRKKKYVFAFLVHPRGIDDTYRKYSFFKYLPNKIIYFWLRHFWPVVVSKIDGLNSLKDGKKIPGYVITIPLTARQMIENRNLANKKIIQAISLAEKLGAKIVGLGALTSSVTRGGADLIDKVGISITTGHAFTSFIVASNLFKLAKLLNMDLSYISVAIVGATGSIGSTSAKILARGGVKNFLLIDLERKKHLFKDIIDELKKLSPDIQIEISHQVGSVKIADFIIAATNAPEAIIKAEDLKSGAIIIDDAQPSDVSPEVFDRDDILVLEAGVVETPGINTHFNFGLKNKFHNFSCLGEVLILAAQEWEGHYVINRATLDLIDKVVPIAKKLNFKLADFQNFKELISEEKLSAMRKIIAKNQNV